MSYKQKEEVKGKNNEASLIKKSRVRFVEQDRIVSGADKLMLKNEESKDKKDPQDMQTSSNSSLDEKEVRSETLDKTVPLAARNDQRTGSKDLLTLYQVYGNMSDYGRSALNRTEGFVYMTIPPDGKYGWVILLAAFLSGVVIDGNVMSVSAVLSSIEDDLHVEKRISAFIVSLQTTTYLCVGPISSAFINKLGFRNVAFIGLGSSIFGLIVGSFCTDPISLSIFFGFFFGCGCGMVIMVNQLIVAYYFEKYRTIAVGLQSSSVGIGLLAYGALNSYISKSLGWSYNLLIMSASFFVCYAFAATFKRIPPTKIARIVDVQPGEEESFESIEVGTTRFSQYAEDEFKQKSYMSTTPSQMQRPGPSQKAQSASTDIMTKSFTTQLDEETNEQRILLNADPLERVDIFLPFNPDYNTTENILERNAQILPGKEQEAKEINYRMTMSRSMVAPEHAKKKRTEECCTINKKIKGGLIMLFDPRLLKSVEFEILQIANCAFQLANFIPYLYIRERTKIPEKYANWLLSNMGVVNIFLRIFLGFIAYYVKEYTVYLCGGCVLFGSFGVLLSCVIPHNIVWLEFLYSGIIVFASAGFFSLRAIVLINILGIEKLTNAYGLIALGGGIFSFIGINTGGVLVSMNDSTEPAFILSGVCLLLAGLLITGTPSLVSLIRKRRVKESRKTTVRFNKQ